MAAVQLNTRACVGHFWKEPGVDPPSWIGTRACREGKAGGKGTQVTNLWSSVGDASGGEGGQGGVRPSDPVRHREEAKGDC